MLDRFTLDLINPKLEPVQIKEIWYIKWPGLTRTKIYGLTTNHRPFPSTIEWKFSIQNPHNLWSFAMLLAHLPTIDYDENLNRVMIGFVFRRIIRLSRFVGKKNKETQKEQCPVAEFESGFLKLFWYINIKRKTPLLNLAEFWKTMRKISVVEL